MDNFWSGTLQNLIANAAAAFLGVIAAWLVRQVWERWRFGRWRVVVLKRGETKVDRPISVGKAKEIIQEPAELSVFLKGVASPYGWINCDIIQDGCNLGLLEKDARRRIYTINLDKNPQPPKAGPSLTDILDEIRQLPCQTSPAQVSGGSAPPGPHNEPEAATGLSAM